jgi:hypothetical protein
VSFVSSGYFSLCHSTSFKDFKLYPVSYFHKKNRSYNIYFKLSETASDMCQFNFSKIWECAVYQWLTPIILATWEDEIRRIMVGDQPGKYFK